MFIKRTILFLACVILVSLTVTFHSSLIDFYEKNDGIIGLFTALICTTLSILYSKKSAFYLFLQRNIVLPFKNSNTKWSFKIVYDFPHDNDDDIIKLKPALKEALLKASANISKSFENHIEANLNRELQLSISLLNGVIELKTSKITVPYEHSQLRITEISEFLHTIETTILPIRKSYLIRIEYDKTNPYFGLFVKDIDIESLIHFQIKYASKPDTGIIEVNSKSLSISSENFSTIERHATRIINMHP